jgi:hypothetical protein
VASPASAAKAVVSNPTNNAIATTVSLTSTPNPEFRYASEISGARDAVKLAKITDLVRSLVYVHFNISVNSTP